MLQRLWLADLPTRRRLDDPARRPGDARPGDPLRGAAAADRIGLPVLVDVPGGVQAHVRDLAAALIALGHEVAVLAPGRRGSPTAAGRSSRPAGGRWRAATTGRSPGSRSARSRTPGSGAGSPSTTFDVLHLHEPATPSLSLAARCSRPRARSWRPSTRSTERSRALLRCSRGRCSALMEKVTARIAVSPMARRVQVEHLGGDAVEIPNGVDVALFATARCCPATRAHGRHGRVPRPVRRAAQGHGGAARRAAPARPAPARAAAAGRRPRRRRRPAPRRRPGLADRLDVLGGVDDATKAPALRSMDVYCAPNTGGESFGIVLTEAMAAGAPVLASDLDAFRAVLAGRRFDGGRRGYGGRVCSPPATPPRSPPRWPRCSTTRRRRAALAAAGRARAAASTGRSSRRDVLRVYRAAIAADPRRVPAGRRDGEAGPACCRLAGDARWRWPPWRCYARGLSLPCCARCAPAGWTGCTSGPTPPARALAAALERRGRSRSARRRARRPPQRGPAASALRPARPAVSRTRCGATRRRAAEAAEPTTLGRAARARRRRPRRAARRARRRARRRRAAPSCSPGGCTTTPSATPSTCARAGSCGGCGSRARPRCPPTSRSRTRAWRRAGR